MSLALFRTTLKLSRWAIVAWVVFLVLYGFSILLLFPSIQETAGAVMEEYVRSLPEGMLKAMGLTEELLDDMFAAGGLTLEGFLGTEYLNWWPLMAGIYAFMFCSGIVARESERGTMELLMSHPIPRYRVVVSKFVAFLAITAILMVFSIAGIAMGLPMVDATLDMVRVSLVTLQGGLAVASVAAYSLLFSCLVMDPRKAMVMAGGLTAALYILNILGPVLGSFDWIQRFSLFYHFQPLKILLQGDFAFSSILVYLGITTACFVAALVVFQRRKVVV